jgi:hypothetical protein
MRNRSIVIVLSCLCLAGIACNAPGSDGPTPAPISESTPAPSSSGSTTTPAPAQPTASPVPGATEPQRISFEAGATSATVQGTLDAGGTQSYVLGAVVSQTMTITVSASGGTIGLKVVTPGGLMILDPSQGQTSWSGPLPETGDYTLSVVLLSGGPATFSITVEIPPGDAAQCWVTTPADMTAYMESSRNADVFGTAPGGDTTLALVRTKDGWLGFDPGVAQAANVGRARLRWFDTADGALSYDPAGCENNLPLVLSLESLENGRYQVLGEFDVTLSDGTYTDADFDPAQTGSSVHDTFMAPSRGFGDMNDDGSEDAVIVLATNTGGSGTFIEIVLVLNDNGDPQPVPGYQVGDREPVHTLTIEDGILTTDVTIHADSDPLCCPSIEETWHLKLENGALVSID